MGILSNPEELIQDPISLLARLDSSLVASTSTLPTPPTQKLETETIPIKPKLRSKTSSFNLFRRTTSKEESDSEGDLEDDGYVQLGLNFKSIEIVHEVNETQEQVNNTKERKIRQKFFDCLSGENVDLAELRTLAWSGIPADLRAISWQLLLGYLPTPASRRSIVLKRKRQEYKESVKKIFPTTVTADGTTRIVTGLDGIIWHQIEIDVKRTNSGINLWSQKLVQESLERILYVWAIRHPASGYVQGINDLVTPFFQVFLEFYIDEDPTTFDISILPTSILESIEADTFWSLSKLLSGIQDNYIFAQPGIIRQVNKISELCKRVDEPLYKHLKESGVEFIQFLFRWINCLLMREFNTNVIIRMWDTYLAEGTDAFSEFHLYVCLAFLVKWSAQLRTMDFQAIIIFLQSLPTKDWNDQNTQLLLSEAFMWSRTFKAR